MYAVVTLGLPPETEVGDLEHLYQGMMEISNKHGVAIVGGDMVRSPIVFITVALTGIHADEPMLRSTAQPGDQVAVTGYLGGSGGGLRLMLGDGIGSIMSRQIPGEAAEYLRLCHRRPLLRECPAPVPILQLPSVTGLVLLLFLFSFLLFLLSSGFPLPSSRRPPVEGWSASPRLVKMFD